MCYNAAYSIERNLKHAISREQDSVLKVKLEEMLEQWQKHKLPFVPNIEIEDQAFFVNAFEHKHFPAFYLEENEIQFGLFRWGLVPRWCKDEKKALQIWNQTINARSETIFDKPSYRASGIDRHCVILLDGFFEYHHEAKKKFPFYISPKDGPMYVAGLYEQTMIDGIEWRTFTIITTEGNELMRKIHNNPKNPNRMPVLLRQDQIMDWLAPTQKDNPTEMAKLKLDFFQPSPEGQIQAHTVAQLQGNNGMGNRPEAQEEYIHLDLGLEL
ncbi:SOS response-associated peptidase [bacterium]|jgi:putative SOS response-associated peptidase YedK|nr:SOS response-associated peptidase [bacterium]MDC1221705.1 SOS response-associated peptidase [Salibacteraceae bacterium]